MLPQAKKWLFTGLELCFFVLFPLVALLYGSNIKNDWTTLRTSGFTPFPWHLGIWLGSGMMYGFCRIQSGRYAISEARSVLGAPAFATRYKKMLTDAIAALVDISSSSADASNALESIESSLLKAIADTVVYFRKATAFRCPTVVCNLMTPIAPGADAIDKAWLEPGGESQLECLLKITNTSREELDIPNNLFLPVYRKESPIRRKTPFGAPRAYATHENQIINCTLWLLPHKGRISWSVLWKAYRHFWDVRRTVWSFASLPIIIDDNILGIANIHYRWVRILGKNPELVLDFLVPYLVILGYIIKEKKRRTA